jgi:hypothetical protein
MRTIPFQTVYESILRRHGLDPVGDALTHDTARAIAQHVNKRIRQAWTYWDFPELSHTEERAYRTVWNSTHQFFRGDDLFYIPSMTYYHVLDDAPADPPMGTPPATQVGVDGAWTVNPTYFEILSPVDTYVAYDQVCKKPMGQVLGVYATNPSLNGCCAGQNILNFRPSENGINVCCAPGPTVFVHYMLLEPKFTLVPWIGGKHYVPGDRVYHPATGECYKCRANTQSGGPPDPNFWFLESFPAVFEDYVVPGAYADCLKETFPDGGGDAQVRALGVAAAEAEATAAIQSAIDVLIAQGQKSYWLKPYMYGGFSGSQPWTGTSVTTLTDVCEEDGGFPQVGTPQAPQRGSLWFTGPSDPSPTNPPPAELQPQDMYLNGTTGDVFQFDGTTMAWRKV